MTRHITSRSAGTSPGEQPGSGRASGDDRLSQREVAMPFTTSGIGARRRHRSTIWVNGDALRYSGDIVAPHGRELQAFLNQIADVELAEDGRLGRRSSDAFRLVTGYFLLGDPRAVSPHCAGADDEFDHIPGV